MEIRDNDYLMRQLKELVRVLTIIQGLRKKGKYEEVEQVIAVSLQSMIGIELSELDALSTDHLTDHLIQQEGISNEALKIIAELLFERGDMYWEMEEKLKAQENFNKSKQIYEHIVEHGRAYSLDWNSKISHIKNLFGED
ncbi:MAG: hypothetical protein NW226_25755 [Microscillaceae bacterium]|nr:hypothetical protein [Microscillaceae bacterium]